MNQPDMINHPPHYTHGDVECIEAIEAALGPEGFQAYCRGQAIKYAWRVEHKGAPAQDLGKIGWYADRALAARKKTESAKRTVTLEPGVTMQVPEGATSMRWTKDGVTWKEVKLDPQAAPTPVPLAEPGPNEMAMLARCSLTSVAREVSNGKTLTQQGQAYLLETLQAVNDLVNDANVMSGIPIRQEASPRPPMGGMTHDDLTKLLDALDDARTRAGIHAGASHATAVDLISQRLAEAEKSGVALGDLLSAAEVLRRACGFHACMSAAAVVAEAKKIIVMQKTQIRSLDHSEAQLKRMNEEAERIRKTASLASSLTALGVLQVVADLLSKPGALLLAGDGPTDVVRRAGQALAAVAKSVADGRTIPMDSEEGTAIVNTFQAARSLYQQVVL